MGENLGKYDPPVDLIHGDSCPARTEAEGVIGWDECYMQIGNELYTLYCDDVAHVISQRSKDPSTQAGAVVVDQKNVVVGLGYNGFPRGCDADAFPWARTGDFLQTKYAFVCHAEENAIYNANNSTRGCKIYCTLFPCNECAKTLIQMGIVEVIYESDKYHNAPSCVASRMLLDAAQVKHRQYQCKKA